MTDPNIWYLHGRPVRLVAVAGKVGHGTDMIFGVEVMDRGKRTKLRADKNGDIPGLLDCNREPVNVRDFSTTN